MTASAPLLNRVDPFGDLNRVTARGMFTGNRGCLVDESGEVVRHHRGNLWITCVLSYKDWRSPLDQPGHWTPLFFLDDAVALAAGHRPCGLCRREDYLAYREAVTTGLDVSGPPAATALNQMLARERLRSGRGLSRSHDRMTWTARAGSLPAGTVLLDHSRSTRLAIDGHMLEFTFRGWIDPLPLDSSAVVEVLTPPTSVAALANGFRPSLHTSALV